MSNNICYWCNKPMDYISPDHFIPKIVGGSDTKENIVDTHLSCNKGKHDSIWIKENGRIMKFVRLRDKFFRARETKNTYMIVISEVFVIKKDSRGGGKGFVRIREEDFSGLGQPITGQEKRLVEKHMHGMIRKWKTYIHNSTPVSRRSAEPIKK